MGVTWSQVFPPPPTLTEANLPNQKGKVFIVTGGYSGVGFELAAILYGAGGKVYIAGRSQQKAKEAIAELQLRPATEHSSDGKLEFLHLDLGDLSTIKPAAEVFLAKESRLDCLINNAATNLVPVDDKTPQDQEPTMATNCLGPLLFTLSLLPILQKTATTVSPGSVRIVWASSQAVDQAPTGGINLANLDNPPSSSVTRYMNSKTGNWFLASEFAKRYADKDRILSITQNPGALRTNLLRNAHWIIPWLLSPILHHPIYGAYTELYCALSPELNLEQHGGGYVIPWGRVHPSPRQDLLNALKSKDEGGTGQAEAFWQWCEKQIAEFR